MQIIISRNLNNAVFPSCQPFCGMATDKEVIRKLILCVVL